MFEVENCMLRENKSDLCTLNFILIFVMKNLSKSARDRSTAQLGIGTAITLYGN